MAQTQRTPRSRRQWAIIRSKQRAAGTQPMTGGAYRAAVAAAGFDEHAQVGMAG